VHEGYNSRIVSTDMEEPDGIFKPSDYRPMFRHNVDSCDTCN